MHEAVTHNTISRGAQRLDIRRHLFIELVVKQGNRLLEKWSMPLECQCSRGFWTMSLTTSLDFWSAKLDQMMTVAHFQLKCSFLSFLLSFFVSFFLSFHFLSYLLYHFSICFPQLLSNNSGKIPAVNANAIIPLRPLQVFSFGLTGVRLGHHERKQDLTY